MLPYKCYHTNATIQMLPYKCYHTMLPYKCYRTNATIQFPNWIKLFLGTNEYSLEIGDYVRIIIIVNEYFQDSLKETMVKLSLNKNVLGHSIVKNLPFTLGNGFVLQILIIKH